MRRRVRAPAIATADVLRWRWDNAQSPWARDTDRLSRKALVGNKGWAGPAAPETACNRLRSAARIGGRLREKADRCDVPVCGRRVSRRCRGFAGFCFMCSCGRGLERTRNRRWRWPCGSPTSHDAPLQTPCAPPRRCCSSCCARGASSDRSRTPKRPYLAAALARRALSATVGSVTANMLVRPHGRGRDAEPQVVHLQLCASG